MLKLFNTLSRKVEEFKPLKSHFVSLYTCGPTVYHFQHIGNYRRYIGDDILIRVLRTNGYEVKQVMNITDVGHLTSDEDQGEDKMEKGARELGRTVWEVAKFYAADFWDSMRQLNVNPPDVIAPATEHINEQIQLIQKLEKNGLIYITPEAIYFEVTKFPNYGKLTGQKLEEKSVAAREEIVEGEHKKHPHDFAVWFFTVGHHKDHVMRWSSPWGEGFPGWHIECSAMSMAYLGDTIDIHTGGVDHIPVHHTNEIAQSEGATNQPFVRYWVHHDFLQVDGKKMSKSLQNLYVLKDLKERGFEPLDYRYLVLTAHYKDPLNFTWESLGAAQNALHNLREVVRDWRVDQTVLEDNDYYQKFLDALNNDMNTPQALAVLWEMVKSDLDSTIKAATILKMDEVFGLKLEESVGKPIEVPEEVQKLLNERETARENKNFKQSDELRDQIKKLGFEVLDTPNGQKVKK
jgi:cysteinyl-tRNA synthetase